MQGHLDSDLTELGIRQAQAVAERLEQEPFTALYSSDLQRAYRTAESIAAKTGHSIITEPALRERRLGLFQGFTLAELPAHYPDEFERYVARDPDYVVPNGESVAQKHKRALECLARIGERHPGERVVGITHGGILDSILRHVLNINLSEPRRFKILNASIHTFLWENGLWILHTWGDVTHLHGLSARDD